MNPRVSLLAATATLAVALVACGGGSGDAAGDDATPAPPGSSAGPAAAAAIADTCSLLSDADLASLGKPDAPGRPTQAASGGGVTTAVCHWDFSGSGALDLTIYVFSDSYNGAKEFAKAALESAAADAQATLQAVTGVGDYAGFEIPPTPGSTSSANFLAQKGPVAFKLKFAGAANAAWPTGEQLQQLGKAVAAKVF
jgi:hypothetical protein